VALAKLPRDQLAKEFDLLRKNYPTRYEYSQFKINAPQTSGSTLQAIHKLRFQL